MKNYKMIGVRDITKSREELNNSGKGENIWVYSYIIENGSFKE